MDNTKDFILEESFKLFLSHSYEAVSISDISNAVGFTKGALYHHFKNKEELFMMVIDKYMIIPEVICDNESISLFDYLQLSVAEWEKEINVLFGFQKAYSPLNYMSLFSDALRHYPGYAALKGNFFRNEIGKIEVILGNAIQSGEIRNDINKSLVAANLFSINIGLASNFIKNDTLEEVLKILKKQTFEFYKLLKTK